MMAGGWQAKAIAEAGDPSIVAIPPCPSLRPLEPETTPARVNKLSPRFATINSVRRLTPP